MNCARAIRHIQNTLTGVMCLQTEISCAQDKLAQGHSSFSNDKEECCNGCIQGVNNYCSCAQRTWMFTLSVHLGDASAPQKIIHVTTEAGDVRTLTDRHICGATVEQMPHKIQISTLDPIWKATHPLRPPPPISLNSNSPNWSSPRTS